MFKTILLGNETAEEFETSIHNHISGFSKINQFIGPNDSGKSRFLRRLYIKDFNVISIYETTDNEPLINKSKSIPYSEIWSLIRNYKPRYGKSLEYQEIEKTLNELQFYSPEQILDKALEYFSKSNGKQTPIHHAQKMFYQLVFNKDSVYDKDERDNKTNAIYIPTLRGLRPVSNPNTIIKRDNDPNANRVRSDYFNGDKYLDIFTGLSIYSEITKLLLGDDEERELIQNFEEFIGVFIYNKKVTLIPKHGDQNTLYIKIGNEPLTPIYNLGDANQALLTILFPIFSKGNERLTCFIEEPETHLHPGYQKLLISALKNANFEQHQYFFTTHSPYLINDDEISTFRITPLNERKKKVSILIPEDYKIAIKSLGIEPSDLTLSNSIIWVEGKSDIIYWKHFIAISNSNLVLGKDYQIIAYNGKDNLELLLDSKLPNTIANHIFIRDKDDLNKEEVDTIYSRFRERKINGKLIITPKREIENHLNPINLKTAIEKSLKIEIQDLKTESDTHVMRVEPINIKAELNPRFNISNTSLFEKIKHNPDELKNVDAEELKKVILESAKTTTAVSAKKVPTALQYVKIATTIEDIELQKMVTDVIEFITSSN